MSHPFPLSSLYGLPSSSYSLIWTFMVFSPIVSFPTLLHYPPEYDLWKATGIRINLFNFTVPHTKTTITKQKQKFYGKIYKTLTIPPNLLPPQVIHSFISLRPSSTYKACSQLASVEWLAEALLLRGFPSYSHSLLPLQPHTLPFWQYPTLLKLRVHGSLHQSIPWNKIPVSLWIANA